MPPPVDPVAAWRAVLLAQSRAQRAIERDLAAAGAIPLPWYDVLLELRAAPEHRLRMQELGLRAVLSRTRISRVVAELEAAGLVVRTPDPADGRAALATLTPAGLAAFHETAPQYLAGIEQHFTRYLPLRRQREVVAALQPVIDAHDAAADPRR